MTQAPFENVGTKRPGFWRRQFAPIPTVAQDRFDTIFAIVLPILFLVIDPVVFRSPLRLFGPGYLEEYQLLAYLFCSLEIGLFLTWRTFRLPLRRFSAVFAGAFLAGAFFSTVVGIAILPLTLISMLVVIGLLGFTPFVTAFVFLRNGVRAARININAATLPSRIATAVLSGVIAFGVPAVVHAKVEHDISATVATLISGSAPEAAAAAERLERFRFVSRRHLNEIVVAYQIERNVNKRAILNQTYKNLTGDDLDWRYQPHIFD